MSEHNEIDERLTWLLARAGDEWGPLGVLRAAAAMWPDALDGLHEHNKAVWDAGYSVGRRHERESLQRCDECGAQVASVDAAFHSSWHRHLDRLVDIAAGDKSVSRAARKRA